MMQDIYVDDVLRERWDHSSRVVTFWDSVGGQVESRPYTEAENDAADAEEETAARLNSHEERITALESIVLAGVPDPDEQDTPVWSDPNDASDAYAPRAIVLFNGDRYRNISGAWLVHSPEKYPRGWQNLDVAATTEWAANTAYAVGDEVTFLTVTYECLQAHTSQAGWTPLAVPALWSPVVTGQAASASSKTFRLR